MTYDLLIKNGTVVDGSGAPRRHADVAVKNGRIVEIGAIKDGATEVIDAEGQIVCPGFDADQIASPERATLVHDLPAGGARMVAKAQGISHVLVNGTALYRDGKHTGDFPGQVLRAA